MMEPLTQATKTLPNCTAMNRRVIVQRAVVHHVGADAEGHGLGVGLLYGEDGLLLAVRAPGHRPSC